MNRLSNRTKAAIIYEKGTPDVDNLFAKFGSEEPHFCFGGHTDVVPIGEEGAWSNNPFEPTEKNGIPPTLISF